RPAAGVVSSGWGVSRAGKPRTSRSMRTARCRAGQVLERGGEGEPDALTLFRARVRAQPRSFDSELGAGVGLEPNRLGERLAESYVWIGRWTVVDREHALGPLLDQAEAGVGGGPIHPGAKRASIFEAGESAPGAEHRLLQRVLGVVE